MPNTPREEELKKYLESDDFFNKYFVDGSPHELDGVSDWDGLEKFILNAVSQERAATEQRMREELYGKIVRFKLETCKRGWGDKLCDNCKAYNRAIDQALNELKEEK